MQTANILLGIGGGRDNIVPKYKVTAAEIAVLQVIHGEDAVFDVEPAGTVKRTNREELGRLHEIYGGAMDTDGNGVVSSLFPGAAARVFENLNELDLPSEFYKAKAREEAPDDEDEDGAADPLDDMTKAELVAYAKTNSIEIDETAKKADVLAAIKEADAGSDGDDKDEDGIADMSGSNVLG